MICENFETVLVEGDSDSWDSGSATFSSVFCEGNKICLFYTGWKKALSYGSSPSSIGLAISHDAKTFKKEIKPLLNKPPKGSFSKSTLTPIVFKHLDSYVMFFAGTSIKSPEVRTIGVAKSFNYDGEWEIIGEVKRPNETWESMAIDLGTSIIRLSNQKYILFYSNVNNHRSEKIRKILLSPRLLLDSIKQRSFRFNRTFLQRRIGILEVDINSDKSIDVKEYSKNPLIHLNSGFGEWNSSLFCPGYLNYDNRHFLFYTASDYLTGYQSIGVVESKSPYFLKSEIVSNRRIIDYNDLKPLIDIYARKNNIAFDTPCPVFVAGKIFLFFHLHE